MINYPVEEICEGWICAQAGEDEQARLARLHDLGLLDTPAEAGFDRITRMAAALFDVPFALVSLMDEHRQWFKSEKGFGVRETPRSHAFCTHTLAVDEVLSVTDATIDKRFKNNPLVTGPPFLRFYAGVPLADTQGYKIGTLCVLSNEPRAPLDERECEMLETLAAMAMDQIELHAARRTLRNQAVPVSGHPPDDTADPGPGQAADPALLASLAHDLRGPLTGVEGVVSLLHDETGGGKNPRNTRELARILQKAGEGLSAVVGDIEELAGLKTGHVIPCAGPFSPAEMVEQLTQAILPQSRAKSVLFSLTTHTRSLPDEARGDGPMLRDCCTRLLTHALKNMSGGGIEFSARPDTSATGQPAMTITITALDPGATRALFPEDDLDRALIRARIAAMEGAIVHEGTAGSGEQMIITVPV